MALSSTNIFILSALFLQQNSVGKDAKNIYLMKSEQCFWFVSHSFYYKVESIDRVEGGQAAPSFKPGFYKFQQTVLPSIKCSLLRGQWRGQGSLVPVSFLMRGRPFLFDQNKPAVSIIRMLWAHPEQPKQLWGLNGTQRGRWAARGINREARSFKARSRRGKAGDC